MLIFLLPLIACAWGQDHFYFSKSPENRDVIAGSTVTLPCEVSHTQDIIYYWHLNNSKLTNTTRRHQVGSNLRITRVDRFKDAGEFTCIAENVSSTFSMTSSSAQLQVFWIGAHAVVHLQAPADKDIKPGSELHLRCAVNGSVEIKYDWSLNGFHVNRSERVIQKGKKLIIKDISSSDNGVYRCSARNEAGQAEAGDGFILKLPGPFNLQLLSPPKDVLAKKGDTVRLDCPFNRADNVEWTLSQDGPRQDASRRTSLSNGTLVITKLKFSDQGLYICSGTQTINQTLRDVQFFSARVSVAFIDNLTMESFEPRLSSYTLVTPHGRPFELACLPPRGLPLPKVTWLGPEGMNLSDSGPVRSEDGLLLLESADMARDGGSYSCYAENLAGYRKATIELVITVPPSVPSDLDEVTREEGSNLWLPCPFKGTPYPATRMKWLKDEKYLKHNQDKHFYPNRHMMHEENGTLEIEGLQPSDRGLYRCEVATAGFPPVLSTPYVVVVREKLKFVPRPVSKRLELNTTAKIQCKAQGTPTPIVKWFADLPGGKLPTHVRDVNGTLHFDVVHVSDKGRYTCVATNPQGTINATIDVDVIVSPRFSIKPKNPTEALEGQPVMLHCVVNGDPKPQIKWDKNGSMSELESHRFQVLENGTLLVHDVHLADHGKYGCTAGNSGGLKREEAILVVRSVAGGYEGTEAGSDDSMMTKTVTITLSAAAGYMVLVIGLMVWCRVRRRRRKQAYLNANPEGILLAKAENGDTALANGEKHGEVEGQKGKENRKSADGAETTHSQNSEQNKRSCEKLSFPRQNLKDLKLLGHGVFGQVFIARAEGKDYPVLVKSLQNTRDEAVLTEFKRELDMFCRLSHEHLGRVLGLCREIEPHYLVLEYTDWGDLKHFLQSTRKERSKLSTAQIIELAKQVSLGMEHLSNARFLHKDLAARNCLVASDLRLKVSMVALSKDVCEADYVQVRNAHVPLRWLPYEAVYEDDYSTKSDVYSFAALCYELFHQGDRPFPNVPDSIVMERMQRRELIIKPSKNAPAKMAALLSSCICSSPKDRPTFSNIAITLGEVLNDL